MTHTEDMEMDKKWAPFTLTQSRKIRIAGLPLSPPSELRPNSGSYGLKYFNFTENGEEGAGREVK